MKRIYEYIKIKIEKVLGIFDYDVEARKLIAKSLNYYNKGKIKKLISLRIYNKLMMEFNCSIPPYLEVGKTYM